MESTDTRNSDYPFTTISKKVYLAALNINTMKYFIPSS